MLPPERVLVKGGSALDSLERIGCEELVHENRIAQRVYQSHCGCSGSNAHECPEGELTSRLIFPVQHDCLGVRSRFPHVHLCQFESASARADSAAEESAATSRSTFDAC